MLNPKTLQEYIDVFNASGLSRVHLRESDVELELEKAAPPAPSAPAAVAVAAAEAPAAVAAAPSGNVVASPIVGTFYAAPSPEKPAFVAPGQSVKKGDVLFIIESMKLMNEITSEFSGVVSEILVQNGEAVEFGTNIMVIK